MKKEIVLVAVFFLMSLTAITYAYAIEKKDKIILISEQRADISGDGVSETISLKGIPYKDENSYLKNIFIEVTSTDLKTYKLPLESGSKASLHLVDLNHDGVKDLFANVLTGGSGGIMDNYFYSLKNFSRIDLIVPEPLVVENCFLNGYKAEVLIRETGKRYRFDLKKRKKYYEKLGLYHNGKLNEPTELTINPYSELKPVLLENKKMGLKGVQKITGIDNADTIAYIESNWSFQNGKWNLEKAEVKKE